MRTILTAQRFPVPASQLWAYCKQPANLRFFCPPEMNFRILNQEQLPDEITAGLEINYKLNVFPLLIPSSVASVIPAMRWRTHVPAVSSNDGVDRGGVIPRWFSDQFRVKQQEGQQQPQQQMFYFSDEQVRGPYARWYHEHLFADIICSPPASSSASPSSSSIMVDFVHYRVVPDFLVHDLVVLPQLRHIFRFRRDHLWQKFGRSVCASQQKTIVETSTKSNEEMLHELRTAMLTGTTDAVMLFDRR